MADAVGFLLGLAQARVEDGRDGPARLASGSANRRCARRLAAGLRRRTCARGLAKAMVNCALMP